MQLINDDCLNALKEIPDSSIDSLITDPPAGISFMGKEWDSDKGGRDHWIEWFSTIMREVYRVLKPGAHGLVWALPRTSHWTATALEDAGFEVRDIVNHIFGSGFPKSHNVGKALKDKSKEGIGTALKPSTEHYILVRKPCSEKTVAKNVLKHGTGGINIDASRIGYVDAYDKKHQLDIMKGSGTFFGGKGEAHSSHKYRVNNGKLEQWFSQKGVSVAEERVGAAAGFAQPSCWKVIDETTPFREVDGKIQRINPNHRNSDATYELGFQGGKSEGWQDWSPEVLGRFPANLIFSHSDDCTEDNCAEDCPCLELDKQSGILGGGKLRAPTKRPKHKTAEVIKLRADETGTAPDIYGDKGGASRFFYCAKINTKERNMGLEEVEAKTRLDMTGRKEDSKSLWNPDKGIPLKNTHPTVKTIKLMSYLINLITPPEGIVLDPFMGSGSTGIACKQLGFEFIGIELEPEYFEIAKKRIG